MKFASPSKEKASYSPILLLFRVLYYSESSQHSRVYTQLTQKKIKNFNPIKILAESLKLSTKLKRPSFVVGTSKVVNPC